MMIRYHGPRLSLPSCQRRLRFGTMIFVEISIPALTPRLVSPHADVPSIMLDVQYRMHPALSRFPAKEFYDHSLLDGTVSARGEVVPELKPPQSKYLARRTVDDEDTDEMHNIIFLDHRHPEARKDRSVLNVGEAQLCCDIVEDLLMQNPVRKKKKEKRKKKKRFVKGC